MKIREAKEMDMVDYLSKLGYEPTKIAGKSYWYISPLHDEKTASFKVNRQLNRWFDFAEGKGGNLIDFGVQFFNCSVSDFLKNLQTLCVSSVHQPKPELSQLSHNHDNNQIRILSVHDINSYPLLRYLQQRRISNDIAYKYLKEVRYSVRDKSYYALGFQNGSGGFELRNEYFKGSSSPKDITMIDNGTDNLAVFEGFFNFLSYQKMCQNQPTPLRNFLVLNSASFFEKSLPIMQDHKHVYLYLDNDKTGDKCTVQALSINADKFKDERQLYKQYDDLNDWLINIGKAQKQQCKPRF